MCKRVELMSVWVKFSQFTAANVPVISSDGVCRNLARVPFVHFHR